MSLRKALIRLAHDQPRFRQKLLPLLHKQAVHLDPDQERMFNEIKMMAENEGRFYQKKDAKGAVEFAWREYQKNKARDMRDDFRKIKNHLVKTLADQWSQREQEGW